MRTRRFILLLVVLMTVFSGMAQDSYTQLIKTYIALSPHDHTIGKIREAFTRLNGVMFEPSSDIDGLMNRYLDELIEDGFIPILQKSFQEGGVTEADLNEAILLLSTPESKTMVQHNVQLSSIIETSFKDELMKVIDVVDKGGIPDALQLSSDIDENYRSKFKRYNDAAGMDKMLIAGFESGYGVMNAVAPEGVTKWLNENAETMLMNACYGVITEEDLDRGVEVFSNASFAKIMNSAMSSVVNKEFMTFGMTTVSGYIDWMTAQGAKITETGQYAWPTIKKLFGY